MKMKNNIELVSLHIPKTAGTAFRLILAENINPKNFAKVDIFNSGRIKVNDVYFSGNELAKQVSTIHGHFSYRKLNEYFDLQPNVRYITWVREPVQRVLSNYYFLKEILEARIQEQTDENLFNRMGKTLKEFVLMEENQNVMSKFLDGAPLSAFTFVGVQDQFESELLELQRIMGWRSASNAVHNKTKQKATEHDESIIQLIRDVNEKDRALYQEVLELKSIASQ